MVNMALPPPLRPNADDTSSGTRNVLKKKSGLKLGLFGRSRSGTQVPSPTEKFSPEMGLPVQSPSPLSPSMIGPIVGTPTAGTPTPSVMGSSEIDPVYDAEEDNEDSEYVDEDEEDLFQDSDDESLLFDSQPAPFIRVHGNSLQPRYEKRKLPIPTFNSFETLPPITIARHRGEARKQLTGEDIDEVDQRLSSTKLYELTEQLVKTVPRAALHVLPSIYSDIRKRTQGAEPTAGDNDSQKTETQIVDYNRSEMMDEQLRYPGAQLHWQQQAIGYTPQIESPDFDSRPNPSNGLDIPSHQIETAYELALHQATKSIARPGDYNNWHWYLDNYFRGRYNVNDPPPPLYPFRNDRAQFLPAVSPPSEAEGVLPYSPYKALRPVRKNSYLGTLFPKIQQTFHKRFEHIFLSVFENSEEIFICNNTYADDVLPIHVSLAAHALYSSEVVVFSDLQKDWRFKNNPVVKKAQWRSFAAAPVMTSRGHIIGVLSMTSREPYLLVTPQWRRSVAICTQDVMDALDSDLEKMQQKSNVVKGHRKQESLVDPSLVPEGLTIYKPGQTPPLSADANAGCEMDRFPSFGGKEQSTHYRVDDEQYEDHGIYSASPLEEESFLTNPPASPQIASVESMASASRAAPYYQQRETTQVESRATITSAPVLEDSRHNSMISFVSSRFSHVSKHGSKFDQLCKELVKELKYDAVYLVEVPAGLADDSCPSLLSVLGASCRNCTQIVGVNYLRQALCSDRMITWAAGALNHVSEYTSGGLVFIYTDEVVNSSKDRTCGVVGVCLRKTQSTMGISRSEELVSLNKFKRNFGQLLSASLAEDKHFSLRRASTYPTSAPYHQSLGVSSRVATGNYSFESTSSAYRQA